MKSLIKKTLLVFAKFIPYIDNMVFKWQIFTRVDLGLLFRNFIHQRIFRINSTLPFPIHFTSRVIGFNKIKLSKDRNTIGSFCLSPHCYIQALGGIEIGENFLFAPGIRLISVNHGVNDEYKNTNTKPIKIGNNVWLGTNVIILPEVSIGNNVVVGAGSVVTKSFPDDVVIVGNPARIIKNIS